MRDIVARVIGFLNTVLSNSDGLPCSSALFTYARYCGLSAEIDPSPEITK